MTQPRLPDGFAVQIDGRVKTLGSGSTLLGGSPRRLLRLSPRAQFLLSESAVAGRLVVRDTATAHLARALLDATIAHPVFDGPTSAADATGPAPSRRDVTVVIPVRDNEPGLRRLLDSLPDVRVIVVDDGSAVPIEAYPATVLRHAVSRGPAAARNTGMAHCDTDFVAFLDSDVVPRRGWLEALLGHLSDPAVGLVAPRIVAFHDGNGLLARYEAVHSALDLGRCGAPVLPYGPVSYLPSAAIVCRRSAVTAIGGFDESMHAGEDVDLCWRLLDANFRLRYEPAAEVCHQHRTRLWEWLSRRAFYGTSAAPLAVRHPGKTAALVMPRWTLLAWLLPVLGSWTGTVGGLICAAMYVRRVALSLRAGTDQAGPGDVAMLAMGGICSGAAQLASAACRTYWPVVLAAAVVSRRCRRAAAVAGVFDGVLGWSTRRPDVGGLGPVGYVAVKRLADVAYGTGVWRGMVRHRTLRPLHVDVRP